MIISGIILAAGFSSRMEGKNKLTLELEGKKIIEHVITAAQESNLDELVIVYKDDEIKHIATQYNLRAIYNENSANGMSTSLKIGVNSLSKNSKACLFLLGDMPFVRSKTINILLKEASKLTKDYLEESIIVPFYNGERGNPVIFGKRYYEEILQNTGDLGAREIMKKNPQAIVKVDISDNYENIDIDTPEKYKSILKKQYSEKK